MEYVVWSGNTCTVGWTNVCGVFSSTDMEWLLEMCPKGHFTPCFFTQKSHGMDWTHYMHLRKGETRTFYFDFKEDEQGQALLVALRLRGMEPRRER